MAKTRGQRVARRLPLALALGLAPPFALAQPEEEALKRLAQSSLEELMQIRVTAVTGAPHDRRETPAAVYIISQEDIRRSGHRTIAELLRLVPGMYVGRVNSSSWVVGSRGLTGSSLTSTRYLVMIDGRQVYDPLTSSTWWDSLDLVLEDIDRIEVIRGPGSTLWGANAMNGVISIVTKAPRLTLGTLVQAGIGDEGQADLALRHGAAIGDAGWLRVWGKYSQHGAFDGPTGATLHDQWSSVSGGFRLDRQLDAATTLTWQAEAYDHPTAMESIRRPIPGVSQQFEQVTADGSVDGAHVLFRAVRGFGADEGWRLRAYYDQTGRENSRFTTDRQTFDLDFRAWRSWGGRHDLMWGGEYLWTRDDTHGPVLSFDPRERSWYQLNAFIQNTTELVPGRWFAMLGTKFTQHSFAGFEVQPSARVWWTPNERHSFWAALSRPVRMPSRFESDGNLVLGYIDLGIALGGAPNGIIVPLAVTGDPDLEPERLLAWEFGYRHSLGDDWVLEASLFHNDYRRLIEPAAAILGAFTDAGTGRSAGLELNASGQVNEHWRLEASYSWLDVAIQGPVYQFEERSSPRHMAQVRSYLDIGENWELNSALYYVDRIEQLDMDAYARLDLGLTWRPRPGMRLALSGQNLLHGEHAEASGAQVPRSFFLQLSLDLGH